MTTLQIAMRMIEENDNGLEITQMQYDRVLECWRISIGQRGYFNNVIIHEHDKEWEKCYHDSDEYFSDEYCSVTLQLGLLSNDYKKCNPRKLTAFFKELVEKIKESK